MQNLTFGRATAEDAAALAAIHAAVAAELVARHGKGPWSRAPKERGIGVAILKGSVLAARRGKAIVGTLHLVAKKPWAIDVAYFTPVERPLYLLSMAVAPELQRQGIGRWMMQEAVEVAGAWPADAIRLDAYDAPAGAGGFYAKCGLREVGRTSYRGNPLVYFEWKLSRGA